MRFSFHSFEELCELEKYVRKTKDRKSRQEYQEKTLKEYNRLRALEPGTRVVIKETRDSFAGKTGNIDRHLGGKSQRTLVVLDEKINSYNCYRIPTSWLSDDLSETNLNRIKQN
ncbi:unnamed protein product, partial [marine sediment metagenome]